MKKSSQKSALGVRLAEAMEAAGLNAPALADQLDVDPSYIRNLVSGRRRPSRRTLKQLVAALSVSLEWLERGAGPMRPGGEAHAPSPPPPSVPAKIGGAIESLGQIPGDLGAAIFDHLVRQVDLLATLARRVEELTAEVASLRHSQGAARGSPATETSQSGQGERRRPGRQRAAG